MPTPQELESRLWKALDSDRTVMLGINGIEDGHARPMTAMVENSRSPIWFFTASDAELVRNITQGHRASASFSSKDHELFASLQANSASTTTAR